MGSHGQWISSIAGGSHLQMFPASPMMRIFKKEADRNRSGGTSIFVGLLNRGDLLLGVTVIPRGEGSLRRPTRSIPFPAMMPLRDRVGMIAFVHQANGQSAANPFRIMRTTSPQSCLAARRRACFHPPPYPLILWPTKTLPTPPAWKKSYRCANAAASFFRQEKFTAA